ncbi:MAG: ABC transporter permease [Lawsonibacter sp.]|jgi:cell division transport system permease protein|nr:ABC transporter permease [Lawsonibacter sp.]
MSRRFDAGYYISEGFHSIFTHGFMSFAAVCMIVACLLIMGSFTLLAVNLDNTLGDLENENEMLVYIESSLSEEEARALQPTLSQVENVAQLTFVTREAALKDFKAKHENNAALMDDLPDDTLRHRYRVHVVDIERMAETQAALEAVEGVGEGNVRAAIDIADGFVLVRNIATGVAMVLVGILLVISLFIIANTIKLATFYRREEIAIMKMCGATDGFIEWPFVVEGMILGLSGALIAFLVQWGLYQMVAKLAIQGNGLSLVNMLSYSSMATTILAVFCAVGAVIGVGGSLLAIRKFLQV